jgi:hypothetical protein
MALSAILETSSSRFLQRSLILNGRFRLEWKPSLDCREPIPRLPQRAIVGKSGGETGIRTLGGLAPTTVFETAPFDRSGTSPRGSGGRLMGGAKQRKREIEESLLCRGFLVRGPRAPYMSGAKDGGRGRENPLFSG